MKILIAYLAGVATPIIGLFLVSWMFERERARERNIIEMSREDHAGNVGLR